MFTKEISTRIILLNALKVVLAVFIAGALIFVASGQITKITNSLAEKKRAAVYLQKRSQALASLRVGLGRIGQNIDKIEHVFPPDDNINEFLKVMRDAGNKNGFNASIQAGTPSPTLTKGSLVVTAVPLSISMNGSVKTLPEFLGNVESLPYFTGIRGISINAPSGWENGASISAQAVLYAKQTN